MKITSSNLQDDVFQTNYRGTIDTTNATSRFLFGFAVVALYSGLVQGFEALLSPSTTTGSTGCIIHTIRNSRCHSYHAGVPAVPGTSTPPLQRIIVQSLVTQHHAHSNMVPRLLALRGGDVDAPRPLTAGVALDTSTTDTVRSQHRVHRPGVEVTSSASSSSTTLMATSMASFIAGAIAGSIGVGIAFPLDTLKTKAQVMMNYYADHELRSNHSGAKGDSNDNKTRTKSPSMFQVMSHVWQTEGIEGFFQGVGTMMIAQAIIKSSAFAMNSVGLNALKNAGFAETWNLLLAACFSGLVTSFLVVPFERVKIMMQASTPGTYRNSLHCLSTVIRTEGIIGLMKRGLVPTLWREIPGYATYFFVSGILIRSAFSQRMGRPGLLVFGALSGCLSWIPVYPIDVVKTVIQNTKGDNASISSWDVARTIYSQGGIMAFFDGLTPKLLRAAVNHSVTFFLYEILMELLLGQLLLKE